MCVCTRRTDGVLSLDGSGCDVSYLFPFCCPRDFDIIEDGWTVFSVELEFSRLKTISDDWRISDVNKNFAVSSMRSVTERRVCFEGL